MLALNGIFACMAALGGRVHTDGELGVLRRRIGTMRRCSSTRTGTQAAAAVASYGSAGTLKIPGTVMLVGVFFVSFVLYYFVNWKYLAELWPLR
jgi:cytochrome c oxidase subunit 1